MVTISKLQFARRLNRPSSLKNLVRKLTGWYLRHKRWLGPLLIVALLVTVALLLSGCSNYPGQDAPCAGANRNAPGCQNPSAGIKDDPIGGEWYIDWALKILRSLLSSLSIAAVQLGVGIFWGIYTNLASTDFLACSGGGGGATPTCSAVGVFDIVRSIAFIFFPTLLAWKFFKSYFIGALIETVYESGITSFARLLIGGISLAFLDGLITVAFGLSNSLFMAIMGGASSLSDLGTKVVGSGKSSGVGSVTEVVNLGLLMFITTICLVMAAVFIGLGLVFFLRTILIFILFAISPLAVVAGMTEEFRNWFERWLQSIQAMLIAPIPVAICLALVKNFVQTIPSAHDNPAEFMLQMVYVIAFLAIGATLMFKIAGQVGGAVFGVAIAAASFAVGAGVGALGAGLAAKGSGTEKETAAHDSNTSSKGRKVGRTAAPANYEDNPFGSATAGESTGSPAPFAGGGGGGISSTPVFSATQQQGQLLNAIRGLQESMSASSIRTTHYATGLNLPFSYGAARGVQNMLHWAGSEAGVSSPYLVFTPGESRRESVATDSSWIASQRRVDEAYSSGGAEPLGAPTPPSDSNGPAAGGSGSGSYIAPIPQLPIIYDGAPYILAEPRNSSSSARAKPFSNDPGTGYNSGHYNDPIPPASNTNAYPVSRRIAASDEALGFKSGAALPSAAASGDSTPGNGSGTTLSSAVVFEKGLEYPGEGEPLTTKRDYSGEAVVIDGSLSSNSPSFETSEERVANAIPDPYGGKPPILLPPPASKLTNSSDQPKEEG